MGRKKKVNHIRISEPGLLDVLGLPRLFHKAINEDYGFYNTQVQKVLLERNSWRRLLIAKLKSNRIIQTSYKGNICVGVLLAAVNSDGVGVVNWLYILPKYRKEGVARRMLSRVEKELLKRNCHKLSVTTEIASEFYRKLGYIEEGVLKNHWWGKDFYTFSKVLKKPLYK